MNIFVYRDVLFEMVTYSSDTHVLFSELGGGPVVVKEWKTRPSLAQVREQADDYVTRLVLEAERAAGDAVCPVCKKKYREHPEFRGAFFMEHAYLTRLCNGKLVKL